MSDDPSAHPDSLDGSALELVERLTARQQAGEDLDPDALLRQHPEHADLLRQILPALRLLRQAGIDESRPPAGVAGNLRGRDPTGARLVSELVAGWVPGSPPDDLRDLLPEDAGNTAVADLVCRHIALRCAAGRPLPLTDYLDWFPALASDDELLLLLLEAHIQARNGHSATATTVAYAGASAQHRDPIEWLLGGELPEVPDSPPGFRLGQEIGRGGIGIVYRAFDRTLRREVAVKVLQRKFARHAGMARRFLEEAQVTGRLQHPGIPAVYQVGSLPDGRPYLAMKLIQGETLSELLGRQAALDSLAVFEAICQAVGYAHAQGLIHRDLKSSNVMVGAFGEVQVVDWGFAKLLVEAPTTAANETWTSAADESVLTPAGGASREETQAGSVMGTLAYMPPEQALGEIERVNRRSDVFSLGAILCEILTGRPPYTGDDLRAQAREARLGEAFTRLEACGADAGLIALARRCLAAGAEDRPADAGAVARVVAEHRVAVDERARVAERERAAAQARAEEAKATAAAERRARRLTLGLAVAAVLLLAGAGWFAWQEQARQAGRLQAAREVAGLRAEADGLRQVADKVEVQPALREQLLVRALAVMERAAARLGEVDDPSLRGAVEADLDALRRQRREQEMLARLEFAQLSSAQVTEKGGKVVFDMRQIAQGCREAFTWYLEVADPLALPVEQAASRLGGGDNGAELASALDAWARFASAKEEASWARAVASLLDDDPLRRQIREALAKDDLETLVKLADSPELSKQPAATLSLLGRVLLYGEVNAAEKVLRQGRQAHPGDFWLNQDLGMCLGQVKPPKHEEAVRFLTAAVALRSRSPGARLNLGNALNRQGKHKEAEAEHREAIRLKPDYAEPHMGLGIALRNQGNHKEAAKAFREAIRLKPDDAMAHNNLGFALVAQGNHKEAAEAFREAIRLKPDDPKIHTNLGCALNSQGKHKEAEAEHGEAIRLNPDFAEAHSNLGVALADQGKHKEAAEALREAIRRKPDLAQAHYILGVALHGQGKFEEALKSFRRAAPLYPDDSPLRQRAQQAIKFAEQLIELDALLADVMAGKARPASPVARVRLADLAQQPYRAYYATAASLYADAFAANLGLAPPNRYNAARAAALAGAGQGKDTHKLDVNGRVFLRCQAFVWLLADLSAHNAALSSGDSKAADAARRMLRHWKEDADLDAVRDPDHLAKLSEVERTAWYILWAGVDLLLAQKPPAP
jgi:serine/threonine-protein kinase